MGAESNLRALFFEQTQAHLSVTTVIGLSSERRYDARAHILPVYLRGSGRGERDMAVKRIVTNIAATDMAAAKAFYRDILGLQVVMDQGWIVTFASDALAAPQVSIASQGGSGTPVPDLSIEVDNLDEVLERMAGAGVRIEYGPVAEPWGVRRFYVRDPFGRLLNILSHD